MYCWVRSRRNSTVFDFTVGKVHSLLLKVQSASLNAKWAYSPVLTVLWKEISTIPTDKKLNYNVLVGIETIVKIFVHKNSIMVWYS